MSGRLDMTRLLDLNLPADADFYICGIGANVQYFDHYRIYPSGSATDWSSFITVQGSKFIPAND
jgi:hypothetical protein